MNQIINLDKLYGKQPAWHPSEFAWIKSLSWSSSELAITFYSQPRGGIYGWPDSTKSFVEVSLSFINPVNIQLRLTGKGIHQISGLDIKDISANGLEKLNFQIEEYEDDSIKFFCENIVVKLVS